jgi:hypothetical protein
MTGIVMPGQPLREIQWMAVWSAATRDKRCSVTRKENLVTEENLTPRAANP